MKYLLSVLISMVVFGFIAVPVSTAQMRIIPHITRLSGGISPTIVVENSYTCQSPEGSRTQNVYLGSTFLEGNILTLGMQLPSGSPGFGPHVFPNAVISMSTTYKNPGELDPVFENNIGPDETIVFRGPFEITFPDCTGLEECPFSNHIVFQTPFHYDPSKGNLLIDITVPPCLPEDGLPNIAANNDTLPEYAQSNSDDDAEGRTGTLSGFNSIFEFDIENPVGQTHLDQIFPSLAGAQNLIESINSFPGDGVAILWGFMTGETRVLGPVCNGLVLDIKNARLLKVQNADAAGDTRFITRIPMIGPMEIPVWTQAVNIEDCSKTNLVPNIIMSP